MGIPPTSYLGDYGPGQGRRRVGSDGMIVIKCRICTKDISKEQYRGFSTATCAVCAGELEQGKTAQEIMEQVRVQDAKVTEDLYNDIGSSNFKAHGIGQRLKEVINKIKISAQGRKRKPLLSEKDDI